jgi:lambda family phage portal protein
MGLLDRLRGRTPRSEVRARLEGAMSRRRLRGWQPPLENINSLVASGGPRLLARARELVVTNGYAGNACEAFASNLVGDGIKPSSLIEDAEVRDRVQRLWLAWTDEADADGLTDFNGLQSMVAREMFVAGECFVRLRPRRADDGLLVPLQLQLLQSKMLPFEKTEDLGGGRRIRCGIEFDAIGRRLAYHFRRRHPGDSTDRGAVIPETVWVPASEVLPHRRGPDQGPAACGTGDGAAVPARPIRRRRTRPEEDRGDVRGLHHQDRNRGGAARRDAGRRRRHRHREPRARHAAGAVAGGRT